MLKKKKKRGGGKKKRNVRINKEERYGKNLSAKKGEKYVAKS